MAKTGNKILNSLETKIKETINSKKLRSWHVFCSKSRNDTVGCVLMLAFILTVTLQTLFRYLKYHT